MTRDDLLVTVLLARNRLSQIALVENPSVSLEDLKVYGGLDHVENIVLINHLKNLVSDGILTIAEETQNQPWAWRLSEFGVCEAKALLSQYG